MRDDTGRQTDRGDRVLTDSTDREWGGGGESERERQRERQRDRETERDRERAAEAVQLASSFE